MPRKDALTVLRNFKVTSIVSAVIDDDAAELGMSKSEFIRLCVFIGGPLLRECPWLKKYDRQDLKELAEGISTILVKPDQKIQIKLK